jgi:hypothetical protein
VITGLIEHPMLLLAFLLVIVLAIAGMLAVRRL